MSHKVTVDFEGITIQIQSQCEVASGSLCKIDKVLDRIHKTADRLETSKVKEYEDYLLKSKDKIQKLINEFTESLNKYKVLKRQSFDMDVRYGGQASQEIAKKYNDLNVVLRKQGEELVKTVNDLTGSKLAVIDEMINEGLLNAGQATANDILNKINGVLDLSSETIKQINDIDDVSLRELAYRQLLKDENKSKSFDELISMAQD